MRDNLLEIDPQFNQDLSPLEVPADREDRKTADEDLSFSDSNQLNLGENNRTQDIFNTSLRDDQIVQ